MPRARQGHDIQANIILIISINWNGGGFISWHQLIHSIISSTVFTKILHALWVLNPHMVRPHCDCLHMIPCGIPTPCRNIFNSSCRSHLFSQACTLQLMRLCVLSKGWILSNTWKVRCMSGWGQKWVIFEAILFLTPTLGRIFGHLGCLRLLMMKAWE